MAALSDGLTTSDLENQDWQPFLKGLTQTFEYNADTGLLASSKSWGEATVVDLSKAITFAGLLGSAKGDGVYSAEYDFNGDEVINNDDLVIFEESFNGVSDFIDALENYNSEYDYNEDGVVDSKDLTQFQKTFDSTAKYTPTYNGETKYDKYGKASEVYNAEGIMTQKYVYNDNGFLMRSDSFGEKTDAEGNVIMSADGVTPEMVLTGYTQFNEKSRPVSTWSVYENATLGTGQEESMVQQYVYEKGFMSKTLNFARNGAYTGYTAFDKYGRQTTSYNEYKDDGTEITGAAEYGSEGQKVTSFVYSKQGFLSQTNNYGIDGAYLGKTLFNKQGKPVEAYNMVGKESTGSGLTQKFEYNQFGFLVSSTSYGKDNTMTGKTFYDGYGKALRSENEMGIVVSAYEYDSKGFMTQTLNLAFNEDPTAQGEFAVDVTNSEGITKRGYYVVTGRTEFDDKSRPTGSFQCYWDTQDEGVRVQEFVYTKGFLTSTKNYGATGNDDSFIGETLFDKYGRQSTSQNEYGEQTTKYVYSKDGFLSEAYNYGASKAYMGKTVFNAYGRPSESYNQNSGLTQTFIYDSWDQSMIESWNYGEPDSSGNPVLTGKTFFDTFGKAVRQENAFGSLVADYDYDENGFMTKAYSYGDLDTTGNPTLTGYTDYNDKGRPEAAYSVNEVDGVQYFSKVQEFIYNTNATGDPTDIQYIGQSNTGFLSLTVNYGASETFTGYTVFNKYGQQDKSFNEYGEMTAKYVYSKKGFLSSTYNYGLDNTYTGKTVFDSYSRPVEAYNERNSKVQTFEYNERGFLTTSTSWGNNGKELGKTYYSASQKQLYSTVSSEITDGVEVISTTYEYDNYGFLIRSENFNDGTLTGYTNYDAKSRPVDSYSVYEGTEVLSQVFNYTTTNDQGDIALTGFITSATLYAFNPDATQGDSVANDIDGGEVVFNGTQTYNNYGRPDKTYNHLNSLVASNHYNNAGFADKSYNYGAGGVTTGTTIFDDYGRPDYVTNYRGFTTTDYIYNNKGSLIQTTSYGYDDAGKQAVTSYTVYDKYSKPQETYQCFRIGDSKTIDGTTLYQYGEGTKNYNDDDPTGVITGGSLIQSNEYNSFGVLVTSYSYGRDGNMTSYTKYDAYSRPVNVYNDQNGLVQTYYYSTGEGGGFLTHSVSFAEYKTLNDDGDYDPTWDSSETRTTYYNGYGQQTATYLRVDDGQGGYKDGAKESDYQYNSYGFLYKTLNYNDGNYTGYLIYDASGRQTAQYNAANSLAVSYWYNTNGFLQRSYTHQIE
ncbi:MAG: hypothetical protein HY810_08060 [Candidatus Omnitrophica bacterium]|nr:hypothetical protein [Candidatus Omnitrophota bacterium]